MHVDTVLNQRTWELMSQTGQAFFSSLVEHLATTLGVRVAFIVEAMDLTGVRVAPLANSGVQKFREGRAYSTHGTPCERLGSGATGIYPNNLSDHFPDDAWLQQSEMQSYAAIPLLNEHAQVLGHIGVLDDREMENPDEIIDLLESFAHRVKEEIVRKRLDTGLQRILGEGNWLSTTIFAAGSCLRRTAPGCCRRLPVRWRVDGISLSSIGFGTGSGKHFTVFVIMGESNGTVSAGR